jgi:hypothetical protein
MPLAHPRFGRPPGQTLVASFKNKKRGGGRLTTHPLVSHQLKLKVPTYSATPGALGPLASHFLVAAQAEGHGFGNNRLHPKVELRRVDLSVAAGALEETAHTLHLQRQVPAFSVEVMYPVRRPCPPRVSWEALGAEGLLPHGASKAVLLVENALRARHRSYLSAAAHGSQVERRDPSKRALVGAKTLRFAPHG